MDDWLIAQVPVPEHGFLPSLEDPRSCSECGKPARGHEIPEHQRERP